MIADDSKWFPSDKQPINVQKNIYSNGGRSITALICASLIALAGCSGGSGSGDDDNNDAVTPTTDSASVQGYAVKGPLKNAQVSLYSINLSAPDLKGRQLDTGATDSTGKIINLNVPAQSGGPFLIEVTNGKELDDSDPIIPTLRTVVRSDQLAGSTKTSIVVTPLTTLATEMARVSTAAKNSSSTVITLDNFFTSVGGGEVAAQATLLKGALGLGLLDDVNIFTTSPLITGANNPATALKHRTAIEVNAALFQQMLTAVGGSNADAVFTAYAQDLSDGAIDGNMHAQSLAVFNGHVPQILNILNQSPSALMALEVPGTTPAKLISELNTVIAQEAGATTTPSALTITKSTAVVPDSDDDGTADVFDKFPNNGSEIADTDNDCATAFNYQPNDYLTASAGNGCGDGSDLAPTDPAVQNACQAATGGNDPNRPVANAGLNTSHFFANGNSNRTITLDSSGSCDPNSDALTYQWTVVSVPRGRNASGVEIDLLGRDGNTTITTANLLSDNTSPSPSFKANFAGNYVFSLTVSDGTNTSAPVTVTKTIGKGFYVDIDGTFKFLSAVGALLLLAIPARRRKQAIQ